MKITALLQLLLLGGTLLTCLLTGILLTKLNDRYAQRLLKIGALLSFLTWATYAFFKVLNAPNVYWNGKRLVASAALTLGYNPYSGPNNGVLIPWGYGPIGALTLLPSFIFHSPVATIRAAVALILLITFGTVYFVVLREDWRRPWRKPELFAGFVCICLLSIHLESLEASLYVIHADAIALALAALACLVLSSRRRRVSVRWQLIAAALMVLAFWTKQNIYPILISAPLYCLICDGRRAFISFTASLIGVGLLLSSVLFLSFGGRKVWYCMFFLVSNTPWKAGLSDTVNVIPPTGTYLALRAKMIWAVFTQIVRDILPVLLILIPLIAGQFTSRKPEKSFGEWMGHNSYLLWVLTGLIALPSAIYGGVILEGAFNNFSVVSFFIAVGTVLGVTEILKSRSEPGRFLQYGLISALLLLTLFIPRELYWGLHEMKNYSDEQVAFDYLRAKPNMTFFPENQLAYLLAERRVYHSSYMVVTLRRRGSPVSQEHFLSGMPTQFRYIAFWKEPPKEFLELMPGKYEETVLSDLPDCKVYRKVNL